MPIDITRATKTPAIPAVESLPQELRRILGPIKELIEIREGKRPKGDELDRVITRRDLFESGLINILINGQPVSFPGDNGTGIVPPTTPPDVAVPPAPTGFIATAAIFTIILEWNDPNTIYGNHAYTEIWRADVDDIGQSVKIADTPGSQYADAIGVTGATKYYWIRFRSTSDVVGPFNAVAGTTATTGQVGGVDLSNLIITAAKIANGAVDLGGTKITGLLANLNLAQITDATKIADSLIGNTKLASAAVTLTKIATGAIDLSSTIVTNLLANANLAQITDATKIGLDLINTQHVAPLAIDAAALASNAVTSVKIATDAVINTKLAALSVESAKLADSAVTSTKIANLAVGTAAIASAAITSAKIGAAAVGTAAIANLAVTNALIANLAVGSTKIADAAITSAKVDTAAIATAAIQTAAITTALIANLAVGSAQIADAAITSVKIGTAAVGSAAIANLAVLNAAIANLAVDAAKIAEATITGAKISSATITAANIALATITNAQIASATITGANIASATITAANIASATITNAQIASATITDSNIASATITGAKIASATIGSGNIVDANITTAKIADANITAAKIGTAAVETLKIAGQAVTIPVSAYANDLNVYHTGTGEKTLQAAAITSSGAPIFINVSFVWIGGLYSSDLLSKSEVAIRLYRDSTLIYDTGKVLFGNYHLAQVSHPTHDAWAFSITDQPGSGSYTYYLKVNCAIWYSRIYYETRSLMLLEVKR